MPAASSAVAKRTKHRFRPSSLRDRFDSIEDLDEIALGDLVVVLQIEPKLCARAKRHGEPKRSIGANAGLFAGDPLYSRS
jgi:hypothetical protein